MVQLWQLNSICGSVTLCHQITVGTIVVFFHKKGFETFLKADPEDCLEKNVVSKKCDILEMK